jgi:acid phosphatase
MIEICRPLSDPSRATVLTKGLRPVKKHPSLIAAFLAIATVPIGANAQQPAAPKSSTASHQSSFSVNATAERILNVDILKKELEQYHECTCTCGCYSHDLDSQADRAIAILDRRAAHVGTNQKLAMVLDIDETSLSNYQQLLQTGFAFNKNAFDVWVETGQAPAIPGTLRLYKEAQRLGVSIFFITGRPESQRAVTERNLQAQGYTNWQQLILRSSSLSSETVDVYKSKARAQIVSQGYKLILNVGDQWSDLKGTPEAEFSVKYPDPYYFIP